MFSKFIPALYVLATKSPTIERCILSKPCFYSHRLLAKSHFPNTSSFLIVHYYSNLSVTHIEAEKLRNEEGICWKCRKMLDKLCKFFCSNCGSVVPVDNHEDYFSLFDAEIDFRISLPELQGKFKDLQRLLHPDKFSLKEAPEIAISEQTSALLNKAYFTLLKPLSRGLYMLELEGVFMTEDTSAENPEFLMEIMELNEDIAEMSSIDELRTMYNNITSKVDGLTSEIANAFHTKSVDTAKSLIITFKYYNNVLETLKEKLPPS